MAIPTLTNEQLFNSNHPQQVSAAGAMSIEGTVVKTAGAFVLILATAAVGWMFPVLALPAVLLALVVGLWASFKREPSAPLTLIYSGLQGLALGGITGRLEQIFPGIAVQAVLATLTVFGVILFLFSNGRLRVTPRATKIFLGAIIGYFLFSLVNLGLSLTGVTEGMFGVYSETLFGIPIGIPLGILATILASYSLVMDFDYVQRGVQNQAPKKYEWKATFGIIATLVWLYIELLRLIALFRN